MPSSRPRASLLPPPLLPKNLFAQLLGVAKSFSFFLRPANRTNNSTQLAECFAISALLNLLKICEANAQKKKEEERKKELLLWQCGC